MPRDKDLKRLVRTRMQRTGESYTAARRRLVSRAVPSADRCAALTGIKNDTVAAKTGSAWPEWVRALDGAGATSRSHADIVRYLLDTHGERVTQWWAQTITVGYERLRGLRDVGQRRGGDYEANKSRTFAVPVDVLYRAWSQVRRRRSWLTEDVTIRTSVRLASMRLTWPDGTKVDVQFTDKGAKSSVAIQHRGLATREAMAQAKLAWAARLDALRRALDA